MNKIPKKSCLYIVLVIFLFFVIISLVSDQSVAQPDNSQVQSEAPELTKETEDQKQEPETNKEQTKTYKVTKVIDGDTIELSDGTRVRYIGIDSAEKNSSKEESCLAEESTKKNKELVENKDVRLELDVESKDKYGRTLAYVYAGDVFINNQMVRSGFANVATYPPNVKYQDKFIEAEKEAKDKSLGLWSTDLCKKEEVTAPQPKVTPQPPQEETPKSSPAPTAPQTQSYTGGDKDCADFSTQAEAQAFFEANNPSSDPHRLDRDKDGVVCETLP